MGSGTQLRQVVFGLVLGGGLLAAPEGIAESGSAPAEAKPASAQGQTRAIMDQLFDNLQVLLAATSDDSRFEDPVEKPRIEAAASALAGQASALADHAQTMDRGAVYLGRRLASDTREIQRSIERGQIQRAEYLIHHVTQNCIACHSRLPSEVDSPRAEAFISSDRLDSVAADERAELQIATRRFDDALGTLETVIVDPNYPAPLLIGPVTDYLTVSIRVKNDFGRPEPTLARLRERPDLWPQLQKDVDAWRDSLPVVGGQVPGQPDLAAARALVDGSQCLPTSPADRTGLVQAIAASSILNQLVQQPGISDRDLAEAYYLLGVCEVAIARDYWVSPADFYLATAIRLAPQEPFAPQAYQLLEEHTLADYEGSSEESIPADQQARLRELRALIEATEAPQER